MALAPAVAHEAVTRSGAQADATTAQRYEIKFWASEEQAREMLRIAEAHLEVDPFCRKGPQRNISLYFDTPQRLFYELHLVGVPYRFKLRIRTYESKESPAFLEVKRRVKSVTSKLRTTVPRSIAMAIADGHLDAANKVPPTHDLMEFLYLYQRYMVEPVLLVSARRLALKSIGDGGMFRMTVDRDIQYQKHCGSDLTGRPHGWTPVDIIVRNGHQELRVLFEMKFVDAAPAWLGPAIERLGLQPTSYSKYVAAMSQDMADTDGLNEGLNNRYDDEDGD